MIPKRQRGRQSEKAQRRFEEDLQRFIGRMLEINEQVGFKMSSRGWCYILEEEVGLSKGEFDYAQRLINDCRKDGLLPNGFMADEETRSFDCIEDELDDESPGEYAESIIRSIQHQHTYYYPISFWEDQSYYIQMIVEKIDLRYLFEPICRKYKIPIATSKGWSAIRQRKELVERFKEYEAEGKIPVLLYCGDFDPKGLQISDFLKSNLDELYGANHWRPTNLIIDRFGLNYDFIIENNLSWIENLETGSGKDLANPRHPDHHRDYVQDYLKKYGARKVEANAIVVAREMGRRLCEETINKYILREAIGGHREKIEELQQEVKEYVQKLMKTFQERG